MSVEINKKIYPCLQEGLYNTVQHPEFNNLKIIPSIGKLEREIGLLRDIASDIFGKAKFEIITNPTYKVFINENLNRVSNDSSSDIIFYIDELLDDYETVKNSFTLSKTYYILDEMFKYKFRLSNTDKTLYVNEENYEKFYKEFHYYIKNEILDYDNLLNLCIMVKNGGDLFEKMLTENLPYIDRWTILDTGSTDNTIEIINNVLLGKKKGKLYCEPFINFRDSRNRCFELAGKTCKYNLMLDDTYVVKGKLREFLNTIRGDQFADSYSLLILSDDLEYYSNRITKSENELKYIYKIHEVIQKENNVNVVIPKEHSWVDDLRSAYMEERTMSRKKYDLKLLFEEIEENPNDPRNYYYTAQTYNLLEQHEKAAEYFHKRAFHPTNGFEQEKVDALFEMTRIYNYKLNRPWEECEKYYNMVHEWDPERPEGSYFIGIHYLLENNRDKAYEYLKRAFEIGYPIHRQYSLKPTLSHYYLPVNLAQLCYEKGNYKLGEDCTNLFLQKNKESSDSNYKLMKDWNGIFKYMNLMIPLREKPIANTKPILCFVAEGGFKKWVGSSIVKEGVGGSETFVIELSRNLAKLTDYEIIVFCNCENEEIFEGVKYKKLSEYFYYISNYNIEHCIINRYSEYIPTAINSYVKNIHVVLHDLDLTGQIIPVSPKLKNIFCLSEWHTEVYKNIFPNFKHIIKPFHYGIDFKNFQYDNTVKIPYSFIYSSFPNRGLSIVLKMWSKIKGIFPTSTLNIFCNMNQDWCWQFHKEEMEEVVRLLYEFNNDGSVINHGWVDKKTLGEFWKKSSVWFYPCKFKETFCLTALEAAISKTLVISNDLAALQDTVGDRGVIITGDDNDVTTEVWQQKALEALINNIDNSELINKNYEWALKHSWEERTRELATILDILPDNTLFEEEENFVNIKDVGVFYGYKNDYITNEIKLKGNWESELDNIFRRYLNNKTIALDIGAFIGTNTLKMAKYAKAVYAFEPVKQTFALLNKNVTLNGISNVNTFNIAIGNENKTIKEFWYPNKNINLGCMRVNRDNNLSNNCMKVNALMVRLDDMDVNEPIGLIKIDVEGCESEVIKGGIDIIGKYRPVIIIENWNNGVYEELTKLDYECIQLSHCNYVYISKLNYLNMLNWSNDIPENSKKDFLYIFSNYKILNILEIGTFTGTSVINMLKLLPNAKATTIDRWQNYIEECNNSEIDILKNMQEIGVENIYHQNIRRMGYENRIETLKGDSRDMLLKLIRENRKYDFIYVDGSHFAMDCYLDCELSWELLIKGGVLAIDDYLYKENSDNILQKPLEGVNHFLEKHKSEYKLIFKNYRVFIEKL
jgi:FkbM family methyltransferase